MQSDLNIYGAFHVSYNHARYGGGIYAHSSTISIFQPGMLQISENYAVIAGGGLYLQMNPRLNLIKHDDSTSMLFKLHDNHAAYGGAINFM